jgi:hypothetical protein
VESHRCHRCKRMYPIDEFQVTVRGWVDNSGQHRAAYCTRCMRERSSDRQAAMSRGDLLFGPKPYLPAEPFREWLKERERIYTAAYPESLEGARKGSLPRGFAEYVGVPSRRLWGLRYGDNGQQQESVALDLVERALMHEGSTDLWQLYPHLYPDEAVAA